MRKSDGFTLVEMLAVVAIIAILALMTIPSNLNRIVIEQVNAAIPLADTAKEPIAQAWKASKTLAATNAEIGLPMPEKVVSNYVSSLEVQDGVIHMTFGNKAHPKLLGKVLSFRPGVIEESQMVPIAWVCGYAAAPAQMVVKGENRTNVPEEFLPRLCK